MSTTLLVGGYTGTNGSGVGIEVVQPHDGAALSALGTAVKADSPSFIARHPRLGVVYAVCEMAAELRAFTVSESNTSHAPMLRQLGEAWSAGDSVCHVAVDPHGHWVVTSSYGDGVVQLFTLDENGAVVARFDGPAAVDAAAAASGSEARPSRAHAALVLPDGRIATTDLGHDLLRIWSVNDTGSAGYSLTLDQELALPAGSGPRLLALHASGNIYIVTEHSVELFIVARIAGSSGYALLSTQSILSGGETPADGDTGAHISIDPAGERVYVSVRLRNTLHTFGVTDVGSTLTPLAEISTGGSWPRHHLQHDGQIHVANQLGDTITTFALDANGIPSVQLGELATGAPTCIITV